MKNNQIFLTEIEHLLQKHFNSKYVNEEKFMNTIPDKIMVEIPISKEWLKDIFKYTEMEYIHLDKFIEAYFDAFRLNDLKELQQFKDLINSISIYN